jgi:hypothetical protein
MTAAPYAQQYAVTQDPYFLNRLSQTVVKGAAAIAAETFSSSGMSLPAYQLQQALGTSQAR